MLSDKEISRIVFLIAVKNLDGIELPDDFPVTIVERNGCCEASWPTKEEIDQYVSLNLYGHI
jgi:hypothetical protein